MAFEVKDRRILLKTIPFIVEELDLIGSKGPISHPYHRLLCGDWVNILPVTADGRAVLIRQPRAGSLTDTLEVPGGMVDPGEKDLMLAGLRELEEETGFTSQRVLSLASMNPNPAIMNNRCHFFLAMSCIPNPNRKHFPDAEEDISIEMVPIAELDGMVRTGQINHGLAALCIMLAGKYLPQI